MKRSLGSLGQALERHYRWTLAGTLALFAALALGNMTRWSIWFDEAFSAYLMRFNIAEITYYTAVDVHPPLYYWLLKIWTSLFGLSEIGVRSMSLFFAIVALIGVFVLVRRLFQSPSLALIATTAAAFSPMLVRFAHEARMYTLVLAIVVWGTYVLIRALESNNKKWWILYGVLLALGMLTHYFVALAWLAHWVWRYVEHRSGRLPSFWTKQWVLAHALALGLFIAWLPIVVEQFMTVQVGFWIPPLSAYTPVDYLSNTLLYRQYGAVTGWWAIGFWAAAVALLYAAWWFIARNKQSVQPHVTLLASLAIVPPLLLVVFSLPPLSSLFIDRYVLYTQVMLAVIAVLGLVLLAHSRRRLASILFVVLILSAGAGIANVYYYGNYNKNSSASIQTRSVLRQIEQVGEFGQPVIAASPWIYYEAAFYDSRAHRVYFLEGSLTDPYGSLEMLKQNDIGKIKDIEAFTSLYRYVWYLGSSSSGDMQPPVEGWEKVKSVEAYDYIDERVLYRATLFDTRPNAESR
jgi:mannosyltransferase